MSESVIKQININTNDIELKTVANNLETALWILKYNTLTHFEQIVEITAVDVPTETNRFKVIYVLRSLLYNTTITLSFTTNETVAEIQSIAYLYQSATWLEREIWDMFGIKFNGNKDLRRILTDYGFKGHVMRKDFPLTGFHEIVYDDSEKHVSHEFVAMAQELRVFNFQNSQSELKKRQAQVLFN